MDPHNSLRKDLGASGPPAQTLYDRSACTSIWGAANMYLLILKEKGGTRATLPFQRISCCHVWQSVFYRPLPFAAVMGRFAACFSIGLFSRSSQVHVGLSCVTLLYPYYFVTLPLTCVVKSATSKRARQMIKDLLRRYRY